MNCVQDKVAIVTGGASGLGKTIAQCLVAAGATVIITDIDPRAGAAQAKELDCDFKQQDVTDEDQWQVLIKEVEQQYGALHILVNNAGIEGVHVSTPETATLEDWRAIQRVNVEGVFLGCRTAIALLRRSGGGSIINMSSVGSIEPTPNNMAYGASKAAVRHITKSVALYCAEHGTKIRCNSVHPGVIRTGMIDRLTEGRVKNSDLSYEQLLAKYKGNIPQGEFQDAEDIAYAVLFLASDASKHITGTKMVVDGGLTMAD